MKLPILLVALASTVLVAAPTAANADTPFATLDRVGKHGEIGVQFSLGVFDDVGIRVGGQDFFIDGFGRFDFHGRFDVSRRLSVYSAVAISQLFSDFEDEIGLSNIDLGLQYRIPARRGSNLFIRGGLLLPTASNGFEPSLSNRFGSFTRVTDFASVVDATWARLSLNYFLQSGMVFVQGDLGLDIAIAADGNNPDPLLHVNGALGLDFSSVTLGFELANSIATEGEDNWDSTFATMLRFGRSHVEPYAGLILPIDEPFDVFVFAVGIAGPI